MRNHLKEVEGREQRVDGQKQNIRRDDGLIPNKGPLHQRIRFANSAVALLKRVKSYHGRSYELLQVGSVLPEASHCNYRKVVGPHTRSQQRA